MMQIELATPHDEECLQDLPTNQPGDEGLVNKNITQFRYVFLATFGLPASSLSKKTTPRSF